MTVNDSATLVIGAGNYFTAPVGTPLPEDLTSIPAGVWNNVGHTSLEDIFSIASEGGEATVIGTLQNKSLRTKYSARTETMAVVLQQFDKDALRLFYGSNAPELPNGLIGVPTEPVPTSCAFLAVFIDGEKVFAFYAPKTEIYRGDDLNIGDTESLAGLPLGVKPMQHGSNNWTYGVTPLGDVEATSAIAGSPGTFSPVSSEVPADLGELNAEVAASPQTAWTSGEHVVLGDGSKAKWDGSKWVVFTA